VFVSAALLERWPQVCRVKIMFTVLLTNRSVSTTEYSIKCDVNWIPLRIRFRSRMTGTEHDKFSLFWYYKFDFNSCSHVPCMKEACHTHGGVISHKAGTSYVVAHTKYSCHRDSWAPYMIRSLLPCNSWQCSVVTPTHSHALCKSIRFIGLYCAPWNKYLLYTYKGTYYNKSKFA